MKLISLLRRVPLLLALLAPAATVRAETTLLNVSYDVTREFYREFNTAFVEHWQKTTGTAIAIKQSHGGSSKQVRSVIDGLEADVVTMNQALDVERLVTAGFIPANWAERLPNHSVPYSSTILFVVRKGNPKGIRDWSDLVRDGVEVIIPNPKTSGNGRYSYLGAWGYALRQPGGDETKAREFVRKLFGNVPVLDTGGRGATTTFAQRGIGDVLLTFENEVALTIKELGEDKFEAVTPSVSILAEAPAVWIDPVVAKHGTLDLARAYLEFLFSPEGQEVAARQNFRPSDPAVLARHRDRFAPIELFRIDDVFGSWPEANQVHFVDGGLFDQIYTQR